MLIVPETWKPPMRDLDAALAQRPREVERARELVRLHADQHHHAGAGVLDHARQACRTDAGVGLVEGVDVDLDVVAEHVPLGAVAGEAVERGERIRRNRRAKPLDDVAVIVVVRRLHQHEAKPPTQASTGHH